jgi:hypothetical protein
MLSKTRGWGIAVVAVLGACLAVSCDDGDDDGESPDTSHCPATVTEVMIVAPVAGDTLHVDVPFTVKWCYPATLGQSRIDYSSDDGNYFASLTAVGGLDKPTNTYVWTPAAGQVGTLCYIRIGDYSDWEATYKQVGPFVVQ